MANPELQVDQKIREANERMDRIEEALLKLTVIWGSAKHDEIKAILTAPETSSEPTP